MQNENQPIVVNLPEGQNTLNLLQGKAPEQLDQLAPIKVDISGTIDAPLRWLEKRVGDIDQHKTYLLVNRDAMTVTLIINESDPYNNGKVKGMLSLSDIYRRLGINTTKNWQPEALGQFLKLNRSYFTNKEENREVVNALKSFTGKVNQTVERETKENGNRALSFRQAVDSNIPAAFHLRIPIFSGEQPVEIEVETYATIDGADVTINLISSGAVDTVEDMKNYKLSEILANIHTIAPELVIIEQ